MATLDAARPQADLMSTGQVGGSNHHVEPHSVTLEETTDESEVQHPETPQGPAVLEDKNDNVPTWMPPISAKAAGKQKAEQPSAGAKLDTQSHELFPELGPPKGRPAAAVPKWGSMKTTPAPIATTNADKTNGASTNGNSRASSPMSGVATPSSATSVPGQRAGPFATGLLGRHQEKINFVPHQLLPRSQMRRPLQDILKDINKKSKANVVASTGQGGSLYLTATGPELACRNVILEVADQICSKQSVEVQVPASSRAHIIGKGGSKIKEIQEKTGARITIPKQTNPLSAADENDDVMIPVLIEGNAITAETARQSILKIAGERAAAVSTKLRGIPAEFYPFLAGPHNAHVNALEESKGLQIRVPPHHVWTKQPPPEMPPPGMAPAFLPAYGDNHITLAGDRMAVQEAKLELEKRVEQLRNQLILDQFPLNRGRHQFIVGQQGISPQQFFAETGCAIILPGEGDDDTITVVGPPDRIQAATERAMDLATSMQSNNYDISRLHRNAPGGAALHARDVTRYLRARREIERLEALHQAHIVTPMLHDGGAAPWELYSRDGKNAIRAQAEIDAIVRGHPPARMSSVPVDPFFHSHIRNDITPRVKQDYGVHVVVPSDADQHLPILLVYEGEGGSLPEYHLPRGAPDAAQMHAFQRGLEDARQHILDLIKAQAEIVTQTIDVPAIFHPKLKRYIQQEQQKRTANEIPVRVSNTGTLITLRGPAPSVQAMALKIEAFVEEAIQDEKERGHTTSFEFPQKHVNQLIGRGGASIRELRDKFDVEIQVADGKVDLKGPPAKANAAKAHILALGRQWADEATYTLKVDPQYHRELIGAQGAQINKLQNRYKVQIHFPRSNRPSKDDKSVADGSSDAGRKPRRDMQPDEVIVKGPKKGADEARDEILSLLQYIKDTSHTATVSVQQSQIPSLIGARGSGMDELRQITGARIDVPNSREATSSGKVDISIKGTKSQVAQAKKLIEEKRNVFDQTVQRTLEVDKKHHRSLIGPGGNTLREIVTQAGGSDDRRELARTVQFPRAEADGNVIKVEATADVVDKIIAAMQKLVTDSENRTTDTLDVPAEKHRTLIGRGGDIKKELEAKFKVSIDIPRQGNGTLVKISGLAEDVGVAKAHIADLVKTEAGSSETVHVPNRVHHSVAENGQLFRRLKNDHRVIVDHEGQNPPPKSTASINTRATKGTALPLITDDPSASADAFYWSVASAHPDIPGTIPWNLRGPPENVTKAKTILEAAIEQALQQTTAGYLTLPDPSSHRFVIGQGGKTVNAIRRETGCKISVPRDGGSQEAIVVEGTDESVERAREMILAAIKEGQAPRERY